MTGLVKKLQNHGGQLQLLQSELDKFVQKKKPQYLQEKDCIELLDGSPNFGKATGVDDVCLSPHVWALVFAARTVYLSELGHSDSCGRLRFVVLTLDSDQVRATQFEEKMQPRKHSMDMLQGILKWILRAQQPCKPVAPDAEALPESQAQEREGDQPQRKRIRIRAARKPPAPAACPPPARSIDDVSFSGAAGCVLAGVQDGSAAACNCVAQESCNSSLMTYANTPSPRPACFPLCP